MKLQAAFVPLIKRAYEDIFGTMDVKVSRSCVKSQPIPENSKGQPKRPNCSVKFNILKVVQNRQ